MSVLADDIFLLSSTILGVLTITAFSTSTVEDDHFDKRILSPYIIFGLTLVILFIGISSYYSLTNSRYLFSLLQIEGKLDTANIDDDNGKAISKYTSFLITGGLLCVLFIYICNFYYSYNDLFTSIIALYLILSAILYVSGTKKIPGKLETANSLINFFLSPAYFLMESLTLIGKILLPSLNIYYDGKLNSTLRPYYSDFNGAKTFHFFLGDYEINSSIPVSDIRFKYSFVCLLFLVLAPILNTLLNTDSGLEKNLFHKNGKITKAYENNLLDALNIFICLTIVLVYGTFYSSGKVDL